MCEGVFYDLITRCGSPCFTSTGADVRGQSEVGEGGRGERKVEQSSTDTSWH